MLREAEMMRILHRVVVLWRKYLTGFYFSAKALWGEREMWY